MTKPSVTPHKPLPIKVVEFLRQNPDEELTAVDIATKFDVTYKNVHSLLAKVLEAKQVVRKRNDDGEYIYAAGPSLRFKADVPAAALHGQPTPKAPHGEQPNSKPMPGLDMDAIHHPQRTLVDWLQLPIETQIQPPIRRRGTAEATYIELLDRLTQPGHSFAVPTNAFGLHGLKKVITNRHKETNLRYQYVEQAGQVRFWRVA